MKIKQPPIKGNFNNSKWHAIDLAKKGYYGGNVSTILKEDFTIILDILEVENFHSKYQIALHELNKKEK